MTTTIKVYGLAQQSLANKQIDWDSDTVKCLLTTSSYTPNQDTHRYKSDVTNEVTGTGYSAGGTTLTSCVVSYDSSTNTVKLDADDPSWSSPLTVTFRMAVFYLSTGTDSTSPLLCWVDYGTNQVLTAQPLALILDAAGLLNLTTA